MIRGDPRGCSAVNDFRVSRVDPAQSAIERMRWEQERGDRGDRRPAQRQAPRLPAPIAAALPEADPDNCELVYEYDARGEVVGVAVRDVRSQSLVARFDLDQFVALVAGSGQRGVLLERRG